MSSAYFVLRKWLGVGLQSSPRDTIKVFRIGNHAPTGR